MNIECDTNRETLITSRMLRTVFVEAKINIAFLQHSNMVKSQEMNGAVLGNMHQTGFSAPKMMHDKQVRFPVVLTSTTGNLPVI